MNPITEQWIRKAEGDFRAARREHQVSSDPSYDVICFLTQQCIEKLLKGLLMQSKIEPPHVHDLVVLSDLVLDHYPDLELDRKELRLLSQYAVGFRYPGEVADEVDAREAYDLCSKYRERILSLFQWD